MSAHQTTPHQLGNSQWWRVERLVEGRHNYSRYLNVAICLYKTVIKWLHLQEESCRTFTRLCCARKRPNPLKRRSLVRHTRSRSKFCVIHSCHSTQKVYFQDCRHWPNWRRLRYHRWIIQNRYSKKMFPSMTPRKIVGDADPIYVINFKLESPANVLMETNFRK